MEWLNGAKLNNLKVFEIHRNSWVFYFRFSFGKRLDYLLYTEKLLLYQNYCCKIDVLLKFSLQR